LCLCRSSGCRDASAAEDFRRDWGNDVIFLFLNGILTKLGLLAVIVGIMSCAARIVPSSVQDFVSGFAFLGANPGRYRAC